MENWLLIYNPASGGGKRIKTALDGIVETFQKKDKFVTLYRLDRTTPSLIEQVLEAGHYDGIIACGGDGSVKTIGGLLAEKGLRDLPLGILPNGTCNDFARSLGLPTDLKKCAEILANGRTKKVDVGLINSTEYFANEVAGGVLVNVSYTVDDKLKQAIGSLAYYVAGMGELTHIKSFPIRIETEEGEVFENDAYIFDLNGTDVSGMNEIIKDAVMDDGKMDILVFKNPDFLDVTDTLVKFVTTADFTEKSVTKIRTRHCKITCTDPLMTTVDGEKGPALPLDIEMIPQAITVLY